MSFDGWKECKLEDILLIPIRNGLSKPKAVRGLGVKMVNMGEIFKYDRIFDIEMDRVPTTDKEFANSKLEKGDLLFARQSLVWEGAGKCSVIMEAKEDLVYESHIIRARLNKKQVDPLFYYYYFRSYYGKENIRSIVEQVAAAGIRGSDLIKLTIPLPPLREQQAAVVILSELDEKIELNNRINRILEEMAQAIFKSWFVDFEPFQDEEFEDSELGKIPKGWSVCSLDDVTNDSNTGGDAIQKTPIVDYDTGIKCVRVGDMTNGRCVDGWAFCDVSEENFKKYQLIKNDIIVTRTATLGLNQIIDEDLQAVYNNGLIRLKLKPEVEPLFIYQTINASDYIEYIDRIESESSTRPNMKINYLLKYRFICPSAEIQKKFSSIIDPMRKQRTEVNKQIQNLTTIRDSLLPKLMSGEIRVPVEGVS